MLIFKIQHCDPEIANPLAVLGSRRRQRRSKSATLHQPFETQELMPNFTALRFQSAAHVGQNGFCFQPC
jgi:hypothetical protein